MSVQILDLHRMKPCAYQKNSNIVCVAAQTDRAFTYPVLDWWYMRNGRP